MNQIPEQLCKEEFKFILLRSNSKVPLERGWQADTSYSFNSPVLQAHLQKGGNIGIVCSKGQPLVVDFDSEVLARKLLHLLPPTFTIRSGSGLPHLYYFCKDAENLKVLDADKNTLADVQAERKQCVIPPSTHPNGKKYEVVKNINIAEVSMSEIKAVFSKYLPPQKREMSVHSGKDTDAIKQYVTFADLLSYYGVETGRNPTNCPLGHSSKGGKCFHFDDVKRLAYCFHCEWGGDVISLVQEKERVDFKGAMMWLSGQYGFDLTLKTDTNRQNVVERVDLNHNKIATIILQDNHFLTPRENGILYMYRKGKYVSQGSLYVQSIVEELTGGDAKTFLAREVIESIKRRTYCSLEDFDDDPNVLSVKNGVLDLKNAKLVEHTPALKTLGQIPCEYDVHASCLLFFKFLDNILNKDDQLVVQEMFGYCLYRAYPIHKALMFTGIGSNGKSTLLNVLKKLLGEENISNVSLQSLEFNRFSAAELHGKLANLFPDLPDTALNGSGIFKCLTGGDRITVERKNQQPFGFTNTAKIVFSANQVPVVKDDGDAFFRRWCILNFDRQFSKEDADPDILRKITADSELSGVLNWGLVGLQRLLSQGYFTDNGTIDSVREKYTRLSNPVRAFVSDCMEFGDDESFVSLDDIFRHYVLFCKRNKMSLISDRSQFSKKLLNELPENAYRGRKRIDNIQIRGYFGVRVTHCLAFTDEPRQ